ncbi:MAG: Triosephosphate isomerase [Candidatus Nomurabacteria bacterium GW2011_GWA1_35_8]|uniref:Triosephosphate isomerase n=1 Tax=Candidatus Nomurabacteria bacterium GW2011_GWA1_35_8 TaxID=1618727 RepID=A0A0G0FES0_9BACT|nr:MAG: Triosephosphate isomerase [Candidatus Nomurabacteria bacterium GW2011_GWA1_35_8]
MSKKIAKKIVVGNWKMNPLSLKEAEKLFINIAKSVSNFKKTGIIVCLPFLYLEKLKSTSQRTKKISLGAQDVFWEDAGAYTGEISGDMLYDIGAKYVIVGHSERREMGESNNDVNKKVKAAIRAGLVPVLCVGESMRDKNHEYLNFIKTQVIECLNGVSKNFISKVIIAYEPIWAIGKGAYPATPEEFREMNIFIRKILSDKFGVKIVEDIKIIYGGSVDEKNTEGFIKAGYADGFLVGRASLNPKKFSEIIKICEASDK